MKSRDKRNILKSHVQERFTCMNNRVIADITVHIVFHRIIHVVAHKAVHKAVHRNVHIVAPTTIHMMSSRNRKEQIKKEMKV